MCLGFYYVLIVWDVSGDLNLLFIEHTQIQLTFHEYEVLELIIKNIILITKVINLERMTTQVHYMLDAIHLFDRRKWTGSDRFW